MEKQRLQVGHKVAETQLADLMDQQAAALREWSIRLKAKQREVASLSERLDKLVEREMQLLKRGMAAMGEMDRANDWPSDQDMELDTQSSPPNAEPFGDASEQQLAALLGSDDWLTNEGFVDETPLPHQA